MVAGLEAELRGDFLGRPEPAAAEPFPFPFEVAGEPVLETRGSHPLGGEAFAFPVSVPDPVEFLRCSFIGMGLE